MKDFIKKYFFCYLILVIIFIGNFHPAIGAKYEQVFFLSFNLREVFNRLVEKTRDVFFFNKEDEYREKYFKLLKELARYKLAEEESKFLKSLELIKKKYPKSLEGKVFFNQTGVIYLNADQSIENNALVVDNNWILIGKVKKVTKNYAEVLSLNYPGIQFNVSDINGNLIGLAETTGLGYIEVNYVNSEINIKLDEIIITSGNDGIFPSGFIVGSVEKIESKVGSKKLIINPLANFNAQKVIIVQ